MVRGHTAHDMKASGLRVEVLPRGLARCNALAMQGQMESATREVWVVNDAADAVKSFIAKAEGLEQLDNLNRQLAEIQTGLNKFRSYLDLPTMAG